MLRYILVDYHSYAIKHKIFSFTDTPENLFNIQSSINNTFLLVISEKCLKLSPIIELYLYAFDESIVNEVLKKEIDKLDHRKFNYFRINRLRRWFGPDEMHNFNIQSKFKFAIAFFDHAGLVDIALQDQLRTCV